MASKLQLLLLLFAGCANTQKTRAPQEPDADELAYRETLRGMVDDGPDSLLGGGPAGPPDLAGPAGPKPLTPFQKRVSPELLPQHKQLYVLEYLEDDDQRTAALRARLQQLELDLRALKGDMNSLMREHKYDRRTWGGSDERMAIEQEFLEQEFPQQNDPE